MAIIPALSDEQIREMGCQLAAAEVAKIADQMDYFLVVEDSTTDLVASVRKMITEGYEPIGGIAVLSRTWTNERKGYEESETTYYQAMVKRK